MSRDASTSAPVFYKDRNSRPQKANTRFAILKNSRNPCMSKKPLRALKGRKAAMRDRSWRNF